VPSYCEYAPGDPWHGPYHDEEYGYPVSDDRVLFERLALEINQAGLSWLTVLKKRQAFRDAFAGFDVEAVAAFEDTDRERLLADAGIIRNRRKVDEVIRNARTVLQIRETHGSFSNWLQEHHPRRREEWVSLFRQTFVFCGGEIVGEFLMSTGYLPGAHDPACPVYQRIMRLRPPWADGHWANTSSGQRALRN